MGWSWRQFSNGWTWQWNMKLISLKRLKYGALQEIISLHSAPFCFLMLALGSERKEANSGRFCCWIKWTRLLRWPRKRSEWFVAYKSHFIECPHPVGDEIPIQRVPSSGPSQLFILFATTLFKFRHSSQQEVQSNGHCANYLHKRLKSSLSIHSAQVLMFTEISSFFTTISFCIVFNIISSFMWTASVV